MSLRCILASRRGFLVSAGWYAPWLKLEPAQAEKAYDLLYPAFSPDGRASEEGFLRLVELERKAGRIKGDIPVARIADWQFLKETQ